MCLLLEDSPAASWEECSRLAAIGPAALANAEKINRAGPLPTDAVFIDIWKGAEYGWLVGRHSPNIKQVA